MRRIASVLPVATAAALLGSAAAQARSLPSSGPAGALTGTLALPEGEAATGAAREPSVAAQLEAGVDDDTVATRGRPSHPMQPERVGGLEACGTVRTTVAPELLDVVSEWPGVRLLR